MSLRKNRVGQENRNKGEIIFEEDYGIDSFSRYLALSIIFGTICFVAGFKTGNLVFGFISGGCLFMFGVLICLALPKPLEITDKGIVYPLAFKYFRKQEIFIPFDTIASIAPIKGLRENRWGRVGIVIKTINNKKYGFTMRQSDDMLPILQELLSTRWQ